MYVYKIVGNFDEEEFYDQLNTISQKFLLMYADHTLFLAMKEVISPEENIKLLEKTFQGYWIEEINEKNIIYLKDYMHEWCQNQLIRIDTLRYEEENQDKLKAAWYALDRIEEELDELNKNRKEVTNGKKANSSE